jgi:hypothetical protein
VKTLPCPVCAGKKDLAGDAPGDAREVCWACEGTGIDPGEPEAGPPPAVEVDPRVCPLCAETLPEGVDMLAHAAATHTDVVSTGWPGAPAPPDTDAPASPLAPPEAPAPAPPRRRAKVMEGKPWEPYLSDGVSLNLGSYAVQASVGTVEWAYQLLARRQRDEALEGVPAEAPNMGKVAALARLLLRASDLTQARIRGGHVDRLEASHTRARGAVRSAIDAHPVPWGGDGDEKDAWVRALAAEAAELLAIGISLVEPEPFSPEDLA